MNRNLKGNNFTTPKESNIYRKYNVMKNGDSEGVEQILFQKKS